MILFLFIFQKHKEELHTAKISLIIVVLVLTCWFPFYTSILVLRMGFFNSKNWPQWMKCLTYLLVATYPSLSPCVFAFRCKKLQLELQRMFQTVPTDFTVSQNSKYICQKKVQKRNTYTLFFLLLGNCGFDTK